MSSTYAGNPASYAANITIPSDGDTRDAASVNVAFEALADRTAHLDASRDDHESRLVLARPQSASGNGVASVGLANGGPTTATLTLITSSSSIAVGDILEIDFAGSLDFGRGAAPTFAVTCGVQLKANQNGGGDTAITYGDVTASAPKIASVVTHQVPFNVKATLVASAAGSLVIKATFTLGLDTAGDTVQLQDYFATLKIWRP